MTDTKLADPERERTRTRQEVETEVDEGDGEHTTKIRHYEAEVRELLCEHCNDWHPEDEMVPVGIDVEPGEDPEELDMMCQYHANAFFGYEPDAEEPVYQPIVDELDHWTWREILAAIGPPILGVVAIAAVVTVLTPALSAIVESMTTLIEAVVFQPIRLMTAATGAEGAAGPSDAPITLAVAMGVMYSLWMILDGT